MTSAPLPPTLDQLGGDAKRSYVRQMFTAIAPRYDLLNHVLSLNIDRGWRRHAVRELRWSSAPAGSYLDLCAGTLDLGIALERQGGFRGRIVGADFALPMLAQGKAKTARVRPVGADALQLPFPDGAFDGCLVGFGVRNLADLEQGLAEIARVVKRGGRAVILDFATPRGWPVRPLYHFYFRRVLPLVGRLVSKHTTAYSYLPASVSRFASPDELAQCLGRAGFREVAAQDLTFGIATLVSGTRA
jgi:demethylmenaquinone methyltransferase/2-methoxy-6-polyprenyl-1,4-benzoquinol methylase